ncbi:MAG: ribokinase [Actinomycetota bacterium]|jgi:ribokinase|nr:ribokinase [Actinomycetota bacterium]MDA8359057.1 ribokinase [Actinomycetota bacterium]
MSVRVSVVGAYGVGLTFDLDVVPEAGETVSCRSFVQHHGGKGSNQAVAAARLGAMVSLQTALGDDAFGEGARSLWEREGVAAAALVCAGTPTMVGAILVEPDGENRIVIAPGALERFTPEHLDASLIFGSDVLLVQLEIPLATAAQALAMARRAGVRSVLNPAPAPAVPDVVGLVSSADIVTPNLREARRLLGGVTAPGDQLAARLARSTGGTVVLTAGASGAYVAHDGALTHVEALPVDPIVDSTGAGDAFSAALGVALADGADPIEAARFATRAAAHCVSVPGVIPGLPRREDLEHQ